MFTHCQTNLKAVSQFQNDTKKSAQQLRDTAAVNLMSIHVATKIYWYRPTPPLSDPKVLETTKSTLLFPSTKTPINYDDAIDNTKAWYVI